MLYLLDANVLIDASRDYYAIDRVPEFWDWLIDVGNKDLVKIPIEIYEEITVGNDALADWAKNPDVRAALLFDKTAEPALVASVTDNGYATDLTDAEIEQIGRDPFLLAYLMDSPANRCIVTTENSKPSQTRGNRHIPDACNSLGLHYCHAYEFFRILDFRTDWKARVAGA